MQREELTLCKVSTCDDEKNVKLAKLDGVDYHPVRTRRAATIVLRSHHGSHIPYYENDPEV